MSFDTSLAIDRTGINWSLQFLWTLEVMLLVMRALFRAPAGINWWTIAGSNRSPPECKSGALPNELMALKLLVH